MLLLVIFSIDIYFIDPSVSPGTALRAPRLKDYLSYGAGKKSVTPDFKDQNFSMPAMGLRPSPVGAELTSVPSSVCHSYNYNQYHNTGSLPAQPSVGMATAPSSNMYPSNQPQNAMSSSSMSVATIVSSGCSSPAVASQAFCQQQVAHTGPTDYIQQQHYSPQVPGNVGNQFAYHYQYEAPQQTPQLQQGTDTSQVPSSSHNVSGSAGNRLPYSYQYGASSQQTVATDQVPSAKNEPRSDPRLAYEPPTNTSFYQQFPTPSASNAINLTSVHQQPPTVASSQPMASYQQGYQVGMSPVPQAAQQNVPIPNSPQANSQYQHFSSYPQTNQQHSDIQQNLTSTSTLGYSTTSQTPQSNSYTLSHSSAGNYNQAYYQNVPPVYADQTVQSIPQSTVVADSNKIPSKKYVQGYEAGYQNQTQTYSNPQYSNVNPNPYQVGNQPNQTPTSYSGYIPQAGSNTLPHMKQYYTQPPLQPQICPISPAKERTESASSGSAQSSPGPSPGPSPSHSVAKSLPINLPNSEKGLHDLLSTTPESKKDGSTNVLEPKVGCLLFILKLFRFAFIAHHFIIIRY